MPRTLNDDIMCDTDTVRKIWAPCKRESEVKKMQSKGKKVMPELSPTIKKMNEQNGKAKKKKKAHTRRRRRYDDSTDTEDMTTTTDDDSYSNHSNHSNKSNNSHNNRCIVPLDLTLTRDNTKNNDIDNIDDIDIDDIDDIDDIANDDDIANNDITKIAQIEDTSRVDIENPTIGLNTEKIEVQIVRRP